MSSGFAEQPQRPYDPGASPVSAPALASPRHKVKVGPGGRIVIPAPLRDLAKISEGDTLVLSHDPGGIRLQTMAQALEQARALAGAHLPAGVDLVDDLLVARRRENERDASR